MRYLQWVGLMSSLLFVGAMMAPVPSEAAPTLTITPVNLDGTPLVWPSTTTPVPAITIPVADYTGTCSDETTSATTCWEIARDTYCPDPSPPVIFLNNQLEPRVAAPLKVRASGSAHEWFVPGSSNPNLTRASVTGTACTLAGGANAFQVANAWTIGDYAQVITPTITTDDTQHARLIVIDNSGTAVDKLKLSWVSFKPLATTNVQKRLVVKFSNDFTSGVNTGTYWFGLESGGSYKAVGSGNTVSGDQVMGFSGTGLFVQNQTTPSPIGTTLAPPAVPTSSATLTGIGVGGSAALSQPSLSSFPTCTYPSGYCNPSITLTLDFKVNNDAIGASNSFGAEAVLIDCGEGCGGVGGTINDLNQSINKAKIDDDKALKLICSSNYQGSCRYVGLPGPNQ